MNAVTIVIETKIVLLVLTMCVLFVHAPTAKMFQSQLQGMNTDSFQPVREQEGHGAAAQLNDSPLP